MFNLYWLFVFTRLWSENTILITSHPVPAFNTKFPKYSQMLARALSGWGDRLIKCSERCHIKVIFSFHWVSCCTFWWTLTWSSVHSRLTGGSANQSLYCLLNNINRKVRWVRKINWMLRALALYLYKLFGGFLEDTPWRGRELQSRKIVFVERCR